jgi:succinoglycan biosynthesis transport protein ExoP
MRVFRDGWVAFVIVVAAALAAAALVTLRQPTLYGAKGVLIVSPVRGFLDPSGAGNLATIADTIRRLPSTTALTTDTLARYRQSARSGATAADRGAATADWISGHVTADRIPGSSMIEVNGTAGTQADAVDLTRASVAALAAYVNQSPSSSLPDQFPAGVSVLTPTVGAAEGKVSPAPLRNNLIGLNAGVLLGILAALALGLARRKLRRPAEVAEELGIPVLGVVSGSRRPRPLPDRGVAAARARLYAQTGPHTVLLLTGTAKAKRIAQVGEELARSVLDSGRTALLVDADLSGRATTHMMSLDHEAGLTTILCGSDDTALSFASDARRASNLSSVPVVPAGQLGNADPATVLSRHQLTTAFEEFRGQYDYVVVVGPRLDRLPEVISLSSAVDQTLLVVPRGAQAWRLRQLLPPEGDIAGRVTGALILNRG